MGKTRKNLMKNAAGYAGKPYVWGGESMEEGGYDCSGYIYNVLKDSGFKAGRTTADGYRKLGKQIPSDQKQPGDLLFFGTAAKATHIAIYAGNGQMWESVGGSKNTKSNPGKGVTLSPVSRRKDLFEVRTLVEEGQAAEPQKPGNTTNTVTGVVVTEKDPLFIRPQPNTDHTPLGAIPKGAAVTILEQGTDWHRVSYGGYTGYSAAKHIQIKAQVQQDGNSRPSPAGIKTLRKGDKGEEVKRMQQALLDQNFKSCTIKKEKKYLTADGIWGEITDSIFRRWQNYKGLTVDGICGAKSWAKLGF